MKGRQPVEVTLRYRPVCTDFVAGKSNEGKSQVLKLRCVLSLVLEFSVLALIRSYSVSETRSRDGVDRLQKARNDLIGIALCIRAPIFQIALVPVLDEVDRQPDRSAAIGKAITELVDRLRFMQTRQSQMVVGTVDGDVIGNCFLERLHKSFEVFLAADFAHVFRREVGVQA